jgi:hypothetical protein
VQHIGAAWISSASTTRAPVLREAPALRRRHARREATLERACVAEAATAHLGGDQALPRRRPRSWHLHLASLAGIGLRVSLWIRANTVDQDERGNAERGALRSGLVPLTATVVHVTRPGGRANELLAAITEHLGRETLAPDERGHVRVLLEDSEGAAWQRVHDALDAAGDDWNEYLHLNPQPG